MFIQSIRVRVRVMIPILAAKMTLTLRKDRLHRSEQ